MFESKPTQEQKNNIINTISNLLQNGYSDRDIKLVIDKHIRKFGVEKDITQVFDDRHKKPTDDVNLIDPNKFYYHSSLRIAPGPPTTKYNPETREITRRYEDYFLEMKASYTIKDLVKYYCETMKIKMNKHTISRYHSVFENLLSSYSLDRILFTIDAAAEIRQSNHLNPLVNPFGLTDYMHTGEENYSLKVNLSKQEGVDEIVYRKRPPIFDD